MIFPSGCNGNATIPHSSYGIHGIRSICDLALFLLFLLLLGVSSASHVVVTAKLMNHLIVLKFLLLHVGEVAIVAATATFFEALQVNKVTCTMYII